MSRKERERISPKRKGESKYEMNESRQFYVANRGGTAKSIEANVCLLGTVVSLANVKLLAVSICNGPTCKLASPNHELLAFLFAADDRGSELPQVPAWLPQRKCF